MWYFHAHELMRCSRRDAQDFAGGDIEQLVVDGDYHLPFENDINLVAFPMSTGHGVMPWRGGVVEDDLQSLRLK